jgi:hypothetical protein
MGFSFECEESFTTPYGEMLASLTKDSNVSILNLSGGCVGFCGVLVPFFRANILSQLKLDCCRPTMDEWKLLWETIATSAISSVRFITVWVSNITIGYVESQDDIIQATQIVADVMRTNRGVRCLYFCTHFRDNDIWKLNIEPFVQRNLMSFNLNQLASEPDDEQRAAVVGHLLQSNRDNSAAFFQILVENTDVIIANFNRTLVQDETERRGSKRRAQAVCTSSPSA